MILYLCSFSSCSTAASEFGKMICEDRNLGIVCPGGLKIGISYAMYGRQSKDVCKHSAMSNVNCKAPG